MYIFIYIVAARNKAMYLLLYTDTCTYTCTCTYVYVYYIYRVIHVYIHILIHDYTGCIEALASIPTAGSNAMSPSSKPQGRIIFIHGPYTIPSQPSYLYIRILGCHYRYYVGAKEQLPIILVAGLLGILGL